MELRLNRAIVFVKDMDVMIEFYRDLLGLVPIPGPESSPDWQVLKTGAADAYAATSWTRRAVLSRFPPID